MTSLGHTSLGIMSYITGNYVIRSYITGMIMSLGHTSLGIMSLDHTSLGIMSLDQILCIMSLELVAGHRQEIIGHMIIGLSITRLEFIV